MSTCCKCNQEIVPTEAEFMIAGTEYRWTLPKGNEVTCQCGAVNIVDCFVPGWADVESEGYWWTVKLKEKQNEVPSAT